jgi:hypothetical protein
MKESDTREKTRQICQEKQVFVETAGVEPEADNISEVGQTIKISRSQRKKDNTIKGKEEQSQGKQTKTK